MAVAVVLSVLREVIPTRPQALPVTRRLPIVARGREAGDWEVDRARARSGEIEVASTLSRHHLVSAVDDHSATTETPDFEFTLDGRPVRLELKEKRTPYSPEIAVMWPDVPEPSLLIVDELSLRRLVWADGLGYLIVDDRPRRRWHLFGPWELWLAPRRRYERPGDKGSGPFLKAKVLLDARTSAVTTLRFDVDALIDVVRRSRRALTQTRLSTSGGTVPSPPCPGSTGPPPSTNLVGGLLLARRRLRCFHRQMMATRPGAA